MSAGVLEPREAIVPSADDERIAKASIRKLAHAFETPPSKVSVRIEGDGEQLVQIPMSAFRLLAAILNEMARGNAVTFMPIHAELTTQQAADFLNVSRPFLIRLLEDKKIPHRRVGTHRRVLFSDLMKFKRKTDESRRKALRDIAAESEELGLYQTDLARGRRK
jgi:excisionase family DNA binding protein